MPKARVLAVDDQLYFRVFLEDVLTQHGYEVTTASSVEEADQALGRHHFDAIIADLALPHDDVTAWMESLRKGASEAEILVAASPGDLATAAEALQAGANDYVQKPLDARILIRTLEGALDRRRLMTEHEELVSEHLDSLGTFSMYERALALFGTRDADSLADRIVEGLCIESTAQSGLLWLTRPERPDTLTLSAARGLVRPEEHPSEVTELEPAGEDQLHIELRDSTRLLGVARLLDPIDDTAFRAEGADAALRFAGIASRAVENALAFSGEGSGEALRDPETDAYSAAYVRDAAGNELEKASRFGRHFCLMRVAVAADADRSILRKLVARTLRGTLRATDLLGVEEDGGVIILLPETHGLGAGVLKRRVRSALGAALLEYPDLAISVGHAGFPGDGRSLDDIWHSVEADVRMDRLSSLQGVGAEQKNFGALLDDFAGRATPTRPETAEELTRFLFRERSRVPDRRGLLLIAPGPAISGAVRRGVEELRGLTLEGDVVILSEQGEETSPAVPVTWVRKDRLTTERPFLLYHSEGPSYGIVFGDPSEGDQALAFHSGDRSFVEHLSFQLGYELGIPVAE